MIGGIPDMIMESLRVLLFGMAGIFIVMGVIVLSLIVLNRFGRKQRKDEKDEANG